MTKEEYRTDKEATRAAKKERRIRYDAMRVFYSPLADPRERLVAGLILQPEPMHRPGQRHTKGDGTEYRVASDGSWRRQTMRRHEERMMLKGAGLWSAKSGRLDA